MTTGLIVRNAAGIQVFDSNLVQPFIVQSGSVVTAAKTAAVVSMSAVNYPLIFLRAPIGIDFILRYVQDTEFAVITRTASTVEYRVYEGTAPSTVAGSHGLFTKTADGIVTYDSNRTQTDIQARFLALNTGQVTANTTFTHSVTALDGGRPFVGADIFTDTNYESNGFFAFDNYALYCRYVSATQIQVQTLSFDPPTGSNTNPVLVGIRPRYLYLTK